MCSCYPLCWEPFLVKGEEWYQYMISHFEEFFDGNIIKHFTIRDEDMYDIGSEEVLEKHGEEIHKELYKWIHNEHIEERLFIQSNWKPFYDNNSHNHMYFGYRHMFVYKQYYFQLLFDEFCQIDWGKCNTCKDTKKGYHYEILLYSIRNEDGTFYNSFVRNYDVLSDNLAPKKYWNKPH